MPDLRARLPALEAKIRHTARTEWREFQSYALEADEWADELAALLREPPETAPSCQWSEDTAFDSDAWTTECGEMFQFNDGGPTENHVRYCCYCGRAVAARAATSEGP
jgi:hypothetical protein